MTLSAVAVSAVTLVLAALQGPPLQVGPEPLTARDAHRLAILAVEGDSVPAVYDRWEAARGSLPDPRVADLGMGFLDLLTYRYREADTAMARLLAGAPAGDPLRPYVLVAVGEGALQRGRYMQAGEAFREAAEDPAAASDPPIRALALIRLVGVAGRVQGVRPQVALIAEAAELVPDSDPFLMALFRCARAGRGGGAGFREDAEAGAALARRAGVRRVHASCRMLVAQEYHQAGDVDTAITLYDEVQREQALARDHAVRAATLQWMGYVLLTGGNYDLARQKLLEAVLEGERSGSLSPVAWAHLNLAAVSNAMGDLPAAMEHADRALQLFQEQGDRWGLGSVRGTRAQTTLALGLWDEAEREFTAARDAAQSGGDPGGMVGNQLSLVDVALGRRDVEAAEAALQEAHRLVVDLRMPGWRYGVLAAEAEVALAGRDIPRARRALVEYLQPLQSPVRRYRALARLSEVLVSEGAIEEAADTLSAALTLLEGWRARQDPAGLRRYAFQIQDYREDPDLGVASIIAAVAESGDVAGAFYLAERQRARTLLERLVRARASDGTHPTDVTQLVRSTAAPLPADSIIARLPSGTAALAYTTGVGGEPTTLFLLQASGIRSFRLESGDSLAPTIARFVANAWDAPLADRLASRLGEQVLAPVVPSLDPGIRSLVLVPDGPLHRLPFGALHLSGLGWVGERYVVAVAPSLSVAMALALSPRQRGRPARILAFGDPISPGAGWAGTDPNGFRKDLEDLQPLPGAAREARRVARFSKDARALVGAAATEAALRASHGGFNVLHFATHAVVGGATDDRIVLLLSPGDGSDGVLGPGDLASLDLTGTDLVFLSACETTVGQVLRGEGVQGLTAPLLAAGVRTVVATAWRVDDRTAATMADRFYRGLAQGRSAGESLRAAQESAVADGVPVAEWGSFVLLGDPELELRLREPPGVWHLVGALLVLIGLVVLYGTTRHRLRGGWVSRRG